MYTHLANKVYLARPMYIHIIGYSLYVGLTIYQQQHADKVWDILIKQHFSFSKVKEQKRNII